MAVGFSQDHERIVAIEWLVQRLAVEHCLMKPDAVAEAHKIISEGKSYSLAMTRLASQDGNPDHLMTSISIGAAITMLLEHLPSDVQSTLDYRAQLPETSERL